jgi:hypothetical protein
MNIVWVDDEVTYAHEVATSTIAITNYKNKPQSFDLYAGLPEDAHVTGMSPEPAMQTDRYLMWRVADIKPGERREWSFQLADMAEGDFDENSLYVKGIDPVNVIGVEKWEGS